MKLLICSSIALALGVMIGSWCLAQENAAGAQSAQADATDADGSPDASGVDDAAEHTGAEDAAHEEHFDLAHALDVGDPTHANISDETMELVTFRGDKALFTAVVFLLLLAGLYVVAWKPISEGLEKRERRISDNIANAEKASQDAHARLAEYEAKLAAANTEAQAIVADARKDAEAAGQKLVVAAQEDATRIRERAQADIESAKRLALGELAHESTDVAMAIAQRIVSREVKPEDHQRLIQEMLAKLPSRN
jgi:F-type H+-transporting ATPase subunit b